MSMQELLTIADILDDLTLRKGPSLLKPTARKILFHPPKVILATQIIMTTVLPTTSGTT